MIAALLGIAMTATPACSLPFRTVTSEIEATKIAQRVINAAPDGAGQNAPYELKVDYVERLDAWLAYQVPSGGQRMTGGGGLQMYISACDNRVYGIKRQV